MMRLPYFRYFAPRTVEEAAKILASEGPQGIDRLSIKKNQLDSW